MTLRFAPPRFVVFSAVLATSLALVSPHTVLGQTAKETQEQSPYPGTVVEDIVARVNDQVISTSDYDHAVQDLEQQAQQHQWTEQQVYDQKHNLLRDLIDQQLLLSRGKELDITGETELIKQLDEMRKQNHLDSLDDLQKAAEAQGVSWEDFKASMRNHIISQLVIRQEVGQHINISPSEIQAYYAAHKQDFEQPEQIRLSEILIPTANPDDATQVADAKTKADDAEAKLKGGADFASLAKSVSSGITAASGGDLGDFKRGQLGSSVLENDTFDLKPGQYTEPIRTKQGYVILKVTEHTPGGVQPEKDVEPEIEDQIGEAKMQPALRDYLTKLREDAYIDIKSGYEDSGASPNEMKPVYSAYAPPSPKRKKHLQRTRFNGRGRKASLQPVTETAEATPSNVPSLADVPQGNATPTAKQTAAAKKVTMKPGKKEKIRFGQAPRETLPAAATKTEDAGTENAGTQTVASNSAANNSPVVLNPGDTANAEQPEVKRVKTRFSAEARKPKKKNNGPKIDPFAPPPPTTEEQATQKQQAQPLGLNGDTSKNSKKKKKNLHKAEPKRRMSDEKKDNTQPSSTSPATPETAPAAGSGQQ